jgi:hypothetical protein
MHIVLVMREELNAIAAISFHSAETNRWVCFTVLARGAHVAAESGVCRVSNRLCTVPKDIQPSRPSELKYGANTFATVRREIRHLITTEFIAVKELPLLHNVYRCHRSIFSNLTVNMSSVVFKLCMPLCALCTNFKTWKKPIIKWGEKYCTEYS